VFVAVRGEQLDGNRFAREAIRRGATAVVSASRRPEGLTGATWIQVPDERRAMARMAAELHRHPDREIPVVGITGTNGKTTTAYLLESILAQAGGRPGIVGTVSYRWPGHEEAAGRTTPESADLYHLMRRMVDAGGTEAILEVSSHALSLSRVEGMEFRVAVFTNLSQDHLDFHRDMDSYFAAKATLFTSLPPEATAVINADDPRAATLRERTPARTLSFGMAEDCDVRLLESHSDFTGSTGRLRTPKGEIRIASALPGRPNLWNVMAAAATALALGTEPEAITAGVERLPGVPGRFERMLDDGPFEVIVDFAHTDDALRNLLATIRSLSPARVITLFGCGGDRDRGKRPRMGEAAVEGSDVVVLTSDNPRSEDPDAIADDAEVGVRRALAATKRTVEFHRNIDRRAAIEFAITLARPGDAVVIAGKGHENTQTIGSRTSRFDDREICRAVLARRSRGGSGG
jgi:UDP-N-acetylmuramoyl-L-alanyl-D-glutamate--2,6-diaminopimelate ligase